MNTMSNESTFFCARRDGCVSYLGYTFNLKPRQCQNHLNANSQMQNIRLFPASEPKPGSTIKSIDHTIWCIVKGYGVSRNCNGHAIRRLVGFGLCPANCGKPRDKGNIVGLLFNMGFLALLLDGSCAPLEGGGNGGIGS